MLAQAAGAILGASAPRAPLDVLALGPGAGLHEVALVQKMLDQGAAHLHLYLIDLTDEQVFAAHRHARQVLRSDVHITAFVGDMNDLCRYEGVLGRAPAPWQPQRVVVALGGTLGNIDLLSYVRQVLCPFCGPGDLLLFDSGLCPPPGAADPRLGGPVPQALQDFLRAPLVRRGLHPAEVGAKLGPPPPVLGSYAIEFWCDTEEGPHCLTRIARYEPEPLCAALCALGWKRRAVLRHGGSYHQALFLLERTAQQTEGTP